MFADAYYNDMDDCTESEMQSSLEDYHVSVIFRVCRKSIRHLIPA
jgi:hypothetical protein